MSFREKSAWIILIMLVVLTIVYALHIPPPYTLAPEPSPFLFHVLMFSIGTFVGIVVMAPRDAKTAKDERERLIELRATATSFYIYAFLTLGGLFILLHVVSSNAIGVAYYILFSFVVAEIVNYGLRIYFYRGGF